jgi:hypothetical protein
MVDDAGPDSTAEATPAAAICPWCSAALPSPDAAECPSCQAHLVDDQGVEIPGVTTLYPGLVASAAAPRKLRRTFGSLLVGDDDEIPLPSEAELPALAPPDADVRREMLRLQLDARLAALQAEVKAIEAEDGLRAGGVPLAEEPVDAAATEPATEPGSEPATESATEPVDVDGELPDHPAGDA